MWADITPTSIWAIALWTRSNLHLSLCFSFRSISFDLTLCLSRPAPHSALSVRACKASSALTLNPYIQRKRTRRIKFAYMLKNLLPKNVTLSTILNKKKVAETIIDVAFRYAKSQDFLLKIIHRICQGENLANGKIATWSKTFGVRHCVRRRCSMAFRLISRSLA